MSGAQVFRTTRVLSATTPFTLACHTPASLWHTTAGHERADVAEHRETPAA